MNLTWIFYECVNGPWHVANYCVIPANVTELQVPSGVGVELELVSVGNLLGSIVFPSSLLHSARFFLKYLRYFIDIVSEKN